MIFHCQDTTVKVSVCNVENQNSEAAIAYLVTHRKSTRTFRTDYIIHLSEWDSKNQCLRKPKDSDRHPSFTQIDEKIKWDLECFSRITQSLINENIQFSTEDLLAEFVRERNEFSLFKRMETLVAKFAKSGKSRTSQTYRAALTSFRKFRNGDDIMIDRLSPEIMEEYELWHKSKGNTDNTISFYCRILRAVYNRALDEGIIVNKYPFKRVYTGIDKTLKRALSLYYIKKIKNLDLSRRPSAAFARDIFLMSFYLRGISFVDMAYLRKIHLNGNKLIYRRSKTGKLIMIEWTKEMQAIVDRYKEDSSDYLLPIIKGTGRAAYRSFVNTEYNINYNLKTIAKTLGINIPLTLYVARHSWANAARINGIPIDVISAGMGHQSEYTTRIYLTNLDSSVIDKANAAIIRSLN